ncbi:hypothetical protein [uncultured Croceicoccus sp.]|nr:hypothetical protein [uncultured Croceicoccus sp.]
MKTENPSLSDTALVSRLALGFGLGAGVLSFINGHAFIAPVAAMVAS